MTTEEKTDLYNKVSVMPLEDAIRYAAKLYKEGKDEQGGYVVTINMNRRKAQADLKASRW